MLQISQENTYASTCAVFLWIFEAFKDTFFSEHLQMTASKIHEVSFSSNLLFLWKNLFLQVQFPEFYNYLSEWAKILFCHYFCCIFSLLDFLKQWGFCSVVRLQHAFRKQNIYDSVQLASCCLTKYKLQRRCLMLKCPEILIISVFCLILHETFPNS